jgi:hypothetical protein
MLSGAEPEVDDPRHLPYALIERYGMQPESGPTGMTVERACRLVLGRSPTAADAELCASCGTDVQKVLALMGLREYRNAAPRLLTAAFRDSPRIWHAHIPRTGGTALMRGAIEAGYAIVNWTALAADPRLYTLTRLRRGLFFTGHRPLTEYTPYISRRDRVVVILRDPIERALSMLHYIEGLVREAPGQHDAQSFLAAGFVPGDLDASAHILTPNEQCYQLAARYTCRDALHILRYTHCTPVMMREFGAAYRDLFGTAPKVRVNASRSAAGAQVSSSTKALLLDRNAEDVALVEAVNKPARSSAPFRPAFWWRWK